MNRRVRLGLFTLLSATVVRTGGAAPTADIASTAWQLDVEFYDPQRITIQLPGSDRPTTFWYVLYQVTNQTGQEVQFYPSFRIVTNTLQVVDGGADISPSVYDAIAARHKREYPFFAPPGKVTGPLLQGEENSRASVAVFRTFDPQASSFTLFMSGLSGEIERVANPSFDVKGPVSEDNARAFLLRRTLAVTYDLPGDPETRAFAAPIRRLREWVMR